MRGVEIERQASEQALERVTCAWLTSHVLNLSLLSPSITSINTIVRFNLSHSGLPLSIHRLQL